MSQRTAILISCLKEEAKQIRTKARLDSRSVSNYLQKTIMRWVQFDEQLYANFARYNVDPTVFARRVTLPRGPRAVILWRCSADESNRMRVAARRRGMTMSSFVRHCLRRTWSAAERLTRRKMAQS
jgi:hypothetical protein